ncbi:sigma-54 dependent transcriptional regulator [Luteitalea sp.]|uniref:sigma-54-dependent transcriptional regulator n=1 Tax=Luteitalea sp. TaxID=2004800 RepID=UPI0025B8FF15|nr:sigma-54 dependent transcriptional regulator [Luteitalea sp.]
MTGTFVACQAPWSALIVDDDAGVRQSLRLCLEAAGARVLGVATGQAALEALERAHFDVVFLDLWLGAEAGIEVLPEMLQRQTDLGVIVVTAFASIESAVDAVKRGAVDYIPKPFTPDQIRLTANRVLEAQRLRRRLTELQDALDETGEPALFDTRSQTFRQFLHTAGRAAASDAVVLLRGESGTGKNLLARWLRANGPRATAPFATVNCPALAGELMTSALFGHRKGAFTGAVADVAGKVQEAEGGTLFLDEVGDLSADAQARLLRFLNDRTYERLGEARERQADVRVIAATNRALDAEVQSGRFREDLFYRLNVITLTVPPLRERAEDIRLLADYYLERFGRKQGRHDLRFSPEADRAMQAHAWPGNLRELRNAVERAVILAPGPQLTPADLGLANGAHSTPSADGGVRVGAPISLDLLEREHIARVVAQAPSLEAAARTLDIDATTLQRKRKRYGLV